MIRSQHVYLRIKGFSPIEYRYKDIYIYIKIVCVCVCIYSIYKYTHVYL